MGGARSQARLYHLGAGHRMETGTYMSRATKGNQCKLPLDIIVPQDVMLSTAHVKLVVEDIPPEVWGLCFGKVGGVISCLFGPVRGYRQIGPQCLLTPPVSACSSLCLWARVSLLYLEYFSCLIQCPV